MNFTVSRIKKGEKKKRAANKDVINYASNIEALPAFLLKKTVKKELGEVMLNCSSHVSRKKGGGGTMREFNRLSFLARYQATPVSF